MVTGKSSNNLSVFLSLVFNFFQFIYQERFGDWNIPVFTVSALEHLNLLNDDDMSIFTNSEETGIPELQKYLHQIIDKRHQSKVEEYV